MCLRGASDLPAMHASDSRVWRQREESHRGEGARMLWPYAKEKPLWATEAIIEGSGEWRVRQGDKGGTVKRERTGERTR